MACFFVILMWVITFVSAWVCTMATTMGWTTNGKFDYKGWFDAFNSFLVPLWIVTIVVFILVPFCML